MLPLQFVYNFNVNMRECVANAYNVTENEVNYTMVNDIGLQLGKEESSICREDDESRLVCHFPQVRKNYDNNSHL